MIPVTDYDEIARERACGTKRPYLTRRYAKDDARQKRARFGTPMRVYRCPWCGFWHLTSQDAQWAASTRTARARRAGMTPEERA